MEGRLLLVGGCERCVERERAPEVCRREGFLSRRNAVRQYHFLPDFASAPFLPFLHRYQLSFNLHSIDCKTASHEPQIEGPWIAATFLHSLLLVPLLHGIAAMSSSSSSLFACQSSPPQSCFPSSVFQAALSPWSHIVSHLAIEPVVSHSFLQNFTLGDCPDPTVCHNCIFQCCAILYVLLRLP